MIRQAYCSLDALEEIEAFAHDPQFPGHTALYKVLETHHHIWIPLPEEEFERQLRQNVCLKVLAKRKVNRWGGGVSATPHSAEEHLQADAQALAGTVFVVNESPATCRDWRERYGACVISRHAAQEANFLTRQLLRKEIRPAGSYRRVAAGGIEQTGWRAALHGEPPALQGIPLNALVLVDNYLLGDNARKLDLGRDNLVALLDSLLPPTLAIDFHLLLVTNNETSFLTPQNLDGLVRDIRRLLNRPYRLRVGVVTRPEGREHRRAIIGNYYFGASHHGFACFVEHEAKWPNDFTVDGAFSGIAQPGYDVPWLSMHDELRAVRIQRDRNLRPANDNPHYQAMHLAYGFCSNRLLELID